MKTSRRQLDRLLDPDNPSVTPATLRRAASAVGRNLRVELEWLNMPLVIRDIGDVERYLGIIQQSAARASEQLLASKYPPLNLLWQMKFELTGRHPVEDRALNLVEQINQTWTFVVALEAARILLKKHKNEVFQLAPGAHAALPFDIVSTTGQICAETFAAVRLENNRKLKSDLAKLERHREIAHRYLFFMSPRYQSTEQQPQFERPRIQVWSIGFP